VRYVTGECSGRGIFRALRGSRGLGTPGGQWRYPGSQPRKLGNSASPSRVERTATPPRRSRATSSESEIRWAYWRLCARRDDRRAFLLSKGLIKRATGEGVEERLDNLPGPIASSMPSVGYKLGGIQEPRRRTTMRPGSFRASLSVICLAAGACLGQPCWAEHGFVLVQVQDTQHRPVRGVEIGIDGLGGSKLTGDDGKAKLPVGRGTGFL